MKVINTITPNLNNNKNTFGKTNGRYGSQQSFTGVSQAYDKFCNKFGERVCRPVFNNKFVNKIGYWMRNSENAVKHFLAVGSIITSGMYMHQTYTNKKMDKDRRMTLTANQFLTLCLSTLGAYTMDDKIKNWWKTKHEQFLRLTPEGNAVYDGMIAKNKEIELKNQSLSKDFKIPKYNIDKYISDYGKRHVVDDFTLKNLAVRSKGFNALRSILVFGFVYRFFVPLVVVKPTNLLCDKYLEHKHKKEAERLAAQK